MLTALDMYMLHRTLLGRRLQRSDPANWGMYGESNVIPRTSTASKVFIFTVPLGIDHNSVARTQRPGSRSYLGSNQGGCNQS